MIVVHLDFKGGGKGGCAHQSREDQSKLEVLGWGENKKHAVTIKEACGVDCGAAALWAFFGISKGSLTPCGIRIHHVT